MATPTLYPAYYDKANSILIYQDLGTTIEISVGGGGLESYQNSAMSEAVMAYVYRDEEDNIYGVYEPIRNNKVFRSQFAYADSIDKFSFGSADCFNANLNDVKLIDIASDIKIQSSLLETMVINGNNHSGLQLVDHKHKGNFGNGTPHEAEIYITGNNVVFKRNSIANGGYVDELFTTFFDSVGANCSIINNTFGNSCKLLFQDHTDILIDINTFLDHSGMQFYVNGSVIQEMQMNHAAFVDVYTVDSNTCIYNTIGNNSYVVAANMFINNEISAFVQLDLTNASLINSFIGYKVNYTPLSPKSNVRIMDIAETAYELSVTDGAVTATAV